MMETEMGVLMDEMNEEAVEGLRTDQVEVQVAEVEEVMGHAGEMWRMMKGENSKKEVMK